MTWRTREKLRMIAIADVAQEIPLDLSVCEKFAVHPGIVESRHGAAVETKRARR
jgi:hypothetical protein